MKVRQAAWHTLEEDHGGRCDAPKLYSILVEIVETEVSPKLRQEANDIVKKARINAQTIEEKKQISRLNATITLLENVIGGAIQRPMSLTLYDSEIEIGGIWRPAQACDECRSDFSL